MHRQESIRGGGTRGLLRRHLHRAGLWRRLLLTHRPLARRLLAEFVGTALLVTIVVGSGTAAERLSPGQAGLQLLESSTATALGLAVLILALGPVSGGHFNPVISGRRLGHRPPVRFRADSASCWSATLFVQLAGGVAGAVLANLMYELPALELAATERSGAELVIAEVVATAGLVTVVFALARNGLAAWSAPAVGAYIGAAYWFTSSTSFANPGRHGGADVLGHLRRDRARVRAAFPGSPGRWWPDRCRARPGPLSRCRRRGGRRRRTA